MSLHGGNEFLNKSFVLLNFFKTILGYGKTVEERAKNFKAKGTLFEVVKQTRNLK